ncbi:MAG: hypothetical protein ACP5L5_06610, partial [Vulcanisaeta sp.]|uniref:hypothetical protein n=1 Tax=Vulcanisaeta sp. TaxID=2020871 RepID=UPI003D1522A8
SNIGGAGASTFGGFCWSGVQSPPYQSSSPLLYYPLTLSLNSTNVASFMGCGGGSVPSPFFGRSLSPGDYWLIIEFVNGPGSYISDNYITSISYETSGWSITLTPTGITISS